MKKILVLIAAMTISISAFAQNYKQAVGVKFGNTYSIEYKLNTSTQNFVQFGLQGPWNASGMFFSGFYNWNFNIDPAPGLSWYIGPGAYIGGYFKPTDFYISANVMLGIEYKFDTAPIALAIDFTPGIGIAPKFHFSWNIGLGVKYAF